ncbi:hypothetical protein [Dactylosporangium sp. NPDC051484]|uniref:hypothetical protein n=1 Tax=Dactylosporangium sp. NPDC051484 TaxID=3154942 RepID=UPI00344DE379
MPSVEIDEATDQYLTFAASIARITKGQVVARLVAEARASTGPVPADTDEEVAIHADYAGHRTRATFVRGPGRIEIADGPLAGREYRTPSEAARAVVSHYNPSVSPHRNGWAFWIISRDGAPLQQIRHHGN